MAPDCFHKLWQRTTAVTMCAAVLIALSVPRTALAKACPNLVILIDQSASMAQNSLGQSVPQGSPDSSGRSPPRRSPT